MITTVVSQGQKASVRQKGWAIVLIAINHADTAERVTFKFGPDVPEAIWQNMETGAAVNFVQGPNGPTYAHAFGARDVMVLVRGKRLR